MWENWKDKYPNVYKGFNYANMVVEGEIDASIHTYNSCLRALDDLDRIGEDEECPFYYDPEKAERYLRLVQKFKHVKGANWKSPYIIYEPWQCFMYACIMGFMNTITTRRRFRTAYLEVPRGNGKSAMCSQQGLYFTSLEGELGPQVICASTKKEAARIVFDDSTAMARANESFTKKTGTRVFAHHIKHEKSNGIMKPVSSKSNSLDGLNPSLTIGDEMHEWERKLYDVIDSSLTKRDDSLFQMITTAGLSTEGIGHELSEYTKKVLSGDVEDDTWFGLVYTLDEGDDWLSEKSWIKANPNYGISVDPINFAAKAKKARETPASKYNFLVKHLNLWQNTNSPYFSQALWDKCENKKLKIEDFYGKPCFSGLDIGSKIDLCSNVYIFNENGKYQIFDYSWIPNARIMDNRNVKYASWVKDNYLMEMPGEVINYEKLQNFIIDINSNLNTHELFFDPWSANETSQKLATNGIEMVEMKMTVANLSEAMKKLDAEIRKGNVEHNGSPLLRWCLGNVVAREDANKNVYPRKEHDRLKIDPIVAAIMAMAGYVNKEDNESPYEERGIIVI